MRFIVFLLSLYCGLIYAQPKEDVEFFSFKKYRPTFIAIGEENTRVQLSFKQRLIKKFDLQLGYTQYMFWDLFESSAPFTDINYNPELFYRLGKTSSGSSALDLGLWEHKSNGRDGAESRTWDRSYLRYTHVLSSKYAHFTLTPRLYVVHNKSGNNSDIRDFLGYGDLRLVVKFAPESPMLDSEILLNWVPSKKLDKGALEIGLSMRPFPKAFSSYFFLHFFHGYGEDLLNYSAKSTSLRAGFRL